MTAVESADKGAWVIGEQRLKFRNEVVAKYKKGGTIRALADEYHRSYGLIRALIKESGVAIRGRGGARPGQPRPSRPRSERQGTEDGDRDVASGSVLLDSLGRQVHAARLEGNITQEELANRFPGKMSGPDVSRIERANQSVSIRQLVDLFSVLGKPVAAIIDQVVDESGGEHLQNRGESDYGVWSLSVRRFVEIAEMLDMSPGMFLRLTCGDLEATSSPPVMAHGDLE